MLPNDCDSISLVRTMAADCMGRRLQPAPRVTRPARPRETRHVDGQQPTVPPDALRGGGLQQARSRVLARLHGCDHRYTSVPEHALRQRDSVVRDLPTLISVQCLHPIPNVELGTNLVPSVV